MMIEVRSLLFLHFTLYKVRQAEELRNQLNGANTKEYIMLRNRITAKVSRDRKKKEFEQLVNISKNLMNENYMLNQEMERKEKDIQFYKKTSKSLCNNCKSMFLNENLQKPCQTIFSMNDTTEEGRSNFSNYLKYSVYASFLAVICIIGAFSMPIISPEVSNKVIESVKNDNSPRILFDSLPIDNVKKNLNQAIGSPLLNSTITESSVSQFENLKSQYKQYKQINQAKEEEININTKNNTNNMFKEKLIQVYNPKEYFNNTPKTIKETNKKSVEVKEFLGYYINLVLLQLYYKELKFTLTIVIYAYSHKRKKRRSFVNRMRHRVKKDEKVYKNSFLGGSANKRYGNIDETQVCMEDNNQMLWSIQEEKLIADDQDDQMQKEEKLRNQNQPALFRDIEIEKSLENKVNSLYCNNVIQTENNKEMFKKLINKVNKYLKYIES